MVALLVVLALMLSGTLTVAEALSGFSNPVVIIVAVFFWGSALQGILGMILAIPLTAFLVVFWRLAKDKYISELV